MLLQLAARTWFCAITPSTTNNTALGYDPITFPLGGGFGRPPFLVRKNRFQFVGLFDIGCRGRRLRRPGGKMLRFKAHLGEFVTLHAGRRGRRPLQRTEMTVRQIEIRKAKRCCLMDFETTPFLIIRFG